VEAWLISPIGVGLNLATGLAAAVATEAVCSGLARQPGLSFDSAALVTALILAAALPPGAIGAVAFATVVALGLGKHAYGGLGNNIFNPAMVGYAAVLVSFPAALSHWPVPADAIGVDGWTGATVLTTFKYRGASTVDGIWTEANGFGSVAGIGYEWVGLAFLLGGLVLFGLRLAAWRPALGMVLGLGLLSLAGYDSGSSASLGSPAYHLSSGGTWLAICFVVTDPVTHPSSHRGQWLFGVLVGVLTYLIRGWGNYPDGLAFAVLLGNALTPFLDRRLGRTEAAAR